MASSGSRASGAAAAAAAGALDSLSDPQLATLPAAELVVRLYNHRRASDFSDAALVLAARERSLADAEAEIQRAGEKEARLLAEIRAWERRATEAEALLPRADDRGPHRTAAVVGEKEGVEEREVEAHDDDDGVSEMEVDPLGCTPSAVEGAGAGVLAVATIADAASDDDVDRLSTLRTADALLAPTLQSESELGCKSGDEDARNNLHALARGTNQEPSQQDVETTHDIINTPAADKGKGQAEEGYCAYVLSVASEDSNHDDQTEQEQPLTESQLREMLITMEGQVSAWESEFDAADGGSIPEETTVNEGKINVDEVEDDQGRSEATEARLQDEILVCEHRVVNAKSVISNASDIEEQLRAEIMECKERAIETEVRFWAEIQARGSAVADVEAWKHCSAEGQRQIHAASMTEARLRDELAAWKCRVTEAEASHRAEMKASQDKAADAITRLQDDISKRDQMFMAFKANTEYKMCLQEGYHTAVQTGLRATIDGSDVVIKYFQKEVQELRAKISELEQHGDEQRVSGNEHADLDPSHGQTSGQ